MKAIQYEGKPIDRPGVWSGLPIETYHQDPCVGPSVSSSGLRTIWAESPAHYWATSPYNPNRFPSKRSDAFDLGKAAHHWLLGEADFGKHFVLSPYDDFRTKEARAWRDGERDAGRTVLTLEQMDQIKGMRDGLMRNPLVSEAGILDGAVERSVLWRADGTEREIWLRARPDVIPNASGDFADLKTTESVRRDEIARSLAKWNYPMQAALLRMGCRALGIPFTSFSFVFVEKNPPFCSRVVMLKEHELDRGEKQIRAALKQFEIGLATGQWPGPDGDQTDAEFIETPGWAQTNADNRLQQFETTGSLA